MLTTAIEAAKAAGALLLERKDNITNVEYKDAHNMVSDVDIAAEKTILDIIRAAFPDHSIFSEEQGLTEATSDYLWIIDPLDGTTNYLHHLNYSTVSIGLSQNNQMVLGVVYDPFRDELFAAERGKGATLNGQPLKPSTTDAIDKTLVSMGRAGNDAAKQAHGELLSHLVTQVRSIHVKGSTALGLSYAAAGRYDAHIDSKCQTYDCAAGNLIAMEAGLVVTTFSGEPWQPNVAKPSDVLVTTKQLHPLFLAAIGQ